MSKPPKIDRKTLRTPDTFVQKGNQLLEFVAQQRMVILGALGILFVAAIGFYFSEWWSDRSLEKGWIAYEEAIKAPEKERWEKLKTMHSTLGSSRATFFAAIALADHYFDDAKKELLATPDATTQTPGLATEWYTRALEYGGLKPMERQLVLIDRANTLEMQKKYDEALKGFEDAAKEDGEAKPLALLGVGRIYELKNDTAKATETYQKVAADFSATEYAKLAKNSIRRLKSPLFLSQSSSTKKS